MLEVPCANCQKGVPCDIKPPQVMNLATASVMVFEHNGPTKCPHCGVVLVVRLAGVQGPLFSTVQLQEKSKIIDPGAMVMPPNGGLIKQ